MKPKFHLATLLVVTAMAPLHAEEQTKSTNPVVDPCVSVSQQVTSLVAKDPDRIVEIVSSEIAANTTCSCEVIKAAIGQSKSDAKTVAAIVEAAILAAPEQMRIIAQCAIAVAPDAIAEVQAVLARLDSNSGEHGLSSKSAKSAKVAIGDAAPMAGVAQMPNPLDFPGQGPVGPTPGGPGGIPLIPLIPPTIPTVIAPPVVTQVNPGS